MSNQYFSGVLVIEAQFGETGQANCRNPLSSEISLFSNKVLIVWNKVNIKWIKKEVKGAGFSEHFGAKRNFWNHLMISHHPTFYLKQQTTLKSYAEHQYIKWVRAEFFRLIWGGDWFESSGWFESHPLGSRVWNPVGTPDPSDEAILGRLYERPGRLIHICLSLFLSVITILTNPPKSDK